MIFKGGFSHLHTVTDYSHYLSAPPPVTHPYNALITAPAILI